MPRPTKEFTQHVRLMLDTDRELRKYCHELVREHMSLQDTCPFCAGLGERDYHDRETTSTCVDCSGSGKIDSSFKLEGRLKEWCEELAGSTASKRGSLSTSARKSLSAELAYVDWVELARAYIEAEAIADNSD